MKNLWTIFVVITITAHLASAQSKIELLSAETAFKNADSADFLSSQWRRIFTKGHSNCKSESALMAFFACDTPNDQLKDLNLTTRDDKYYVSLTADGTDTIFLKSPIRRIDWTKISSLALDFTVLNSQHESATLANSNIDDGAFQLFFVFGRVEGTGSKQKTMINSVLAFSYEPTTDPSLHGTVGESAKVAITPPDFTGELLKYAWKEEYGDAFHGDEVDRVLKQSNLPQPIHNLDKTGLVSFFPIYGLVNQPIVNTFNLRTLATQAFGMENLINMPELVAVLIESTAVNWNVSSDNVTEVAIREISIEETENSKLH